MWKFLVERTMPSRKSLYERIKDGEIKLCFNGPRCSPPEYRFWAKVDKDGPVHPICGQCWQWTGCTHHGGYGVLSVDNKAVETHVFSWRLFNGSIPNGQCVTHKCDNPSCVNPNHLKLDTKSGNSLDRDSKGRNASGDRHGSKTHPERIPRGDKHGSRIHPESRPKGEEHSGSKLTEQDVWDILNTYVPGSRRYGQCALARRYRMNQATIWAIVTGRIWKHIYQRYIESKVGVTLANT